jgi:hypothetical protein
VLTATCSSSLRCDNASDTRTAQLATDGLLQPRPTESDQTPLSNRLKDFRMETEAVQTQAGKTEVVRSKKDEEYTILDL